jgi:hypothetical protein
MPLICFHFYDGPHPVARCLPGRRRLGDLLSLGDQLLLRLDGVVAGLLASEHLLGHLGLGGLPQRPQAGIQCGQITDDRGVGQRVLRAPAWFQVALASPAPEASRDSSSSISVARSA